MHLRLISIILIFVVIIFLLWLLDSAKEEDLLREDDVFLTKNRNCQPYQDPRRGYGNSGESSVHTSIPVDDIINTDICTSRDATFIITNHSLSS